ncbi:putative bifunctional chitinase/lysozyme [Paramecium bursaria Chlorella virus NE-JV-1]|nr:putative bifunctional chitinase/lysozyme [Paramecium bursaria Chlorella virus NE-JV-1]
MSVVKETKLTVSVKKTSDWETGFDGAFVLENKNDYDVLEWVLEFDFPHDESFTWFSEGDLDRKDDNVTIIPKEWNNVIKAGETKTLGFGGTKSLPTNLKYKQKLPLVGKDSSLEKRGAWGDKVFAPYVDACAFPTPSLVNMHEATGQKFFTLAFVTADANKKASWAGVIPLDAQHMLTQIREIRDVGGDVSVSFGGANGIELAEAIGDIDLLVAEYSRVIDMYSLTRIDFDIEGAAVGHTKSVDLRNRAIAKLNESYPELQITYCLPVLPIGLTLSGELLARNARKNNARIHSWNGMSMDFGDSAAPDPEGRMASYVIMSCENLRTQILSAGIPNPKIGAIPMIGVNDVQSEILRIVDARKVYEFFKRTPWMSYVGFWSMNRDKPGKDTGANPFDSGIDQHPYDFTNTFRGKIVDELDPSPRPNPPYIPPPQGDPSPLPSEETPKIPKKDVPPIKVTGKVIAVLSLNKARIRYTRPQGGIGNPTVVQVTHGCKVHDQILITLKGTKPFTFVKFEKLTTEKPSKPSYKKNANLFWDDVVAEFTEKAKTEDVDVVVRDLQLEYSGLGPENQERLKKMLS